MLVVMELRTSAGVRPGAVITIAGAGLPLNRHSTVIVPGKVTLAGGEITRLRGRTVQTKADRQAHKQIHEPAQRKARILKIRCCVTCNFRCSNISVSGTCQVSGVM